MVYKVYKYAYQCAILQYIYCNSDEHKAFNNWIDGDNSKTQINITDTKSTLAVYTRGGKTWSICVTADFGCV